MIPKLKEAVAVVDVDAGVTFLIRAWLLPVRVLGLFLIHTFLSNHVGGLCNLVPTAGGRQGNRA